jgi:hypothetical protein
MYKHYKYALLLLLLFSRQGTVISPRGVTGQHVQDVELV